MGGVRSQRQNLQGSSHQWVLPNTCVTNVLVPAVSHTTSHLPEDPPGPAGRSGPGSYEVSFFSPGPSVHQICGCPPRVAFVTSSPMEFLWSSPVDAAKSLQTCSTLCNPIDGSPPGSPVPGILQAITLEWGAISFSNAWKWKVKVKLLSRVRLFGTPWTAAYQAPPSMGFRALKAKCSWGSSSHCQTPRLSELWLLWENLCDMFFASVGHLLSGCAAWLCCARTPPSRLVVAPFSLDIDHPFSSKVVQWLFVILVFSWEKVRSGPSTWPFCPSPRGLPFSLLFCF